MPFLSIFEERLLIAKRLEKDKETKERVKSRRPNKCLIASEI